MSIEITPAWVGGCRSSFHHYNAVADFGSADRITGNQVEVNSSQHSGRAELGEYSTKLRGTHGGQVMISLDRTKEEIEKYLLEAKANGATQVSQSLFFTFLPNLNDETKMGCKVVEIEPKNWVYHLEVTYRSAEENDFRLFHLGVYPYEKYTDEVWATRDWFFKKLTDLGLAAKDSHEQLELEVEDAGSSDDSGVSCQ